MIMWGFLGWILLDYLLSFVALSWLFSLALVSEGLVLGTLGTRQTVAHILLVAFLYQLLCIKGTCRIIISASFFWNNTATFRLSFFLIVRSRNSVVFVWENGDVRWVAGGHAIRFFGAWWWCCHGISIASACVLGNIFHRGRLTESRSWCLHWLLIAIFQLLGWCCWGFPYGRLDDTLDSEFLVFSQVSYWQTCPCSLRLIIMRHSRISSRCHRV